MLTWTLTTSLFLPTSSMQSIPTGRTMVISQAGLPSGGIIVGGENRDGNTSVNNWVHQPFSLMAENMAFMMVTAILTSISISSTISAKRSSR